ncbi:hypothetical protein KZZ07_24325 [Mameliella sp. CS4]|uniref:hypothetical protein n=1 Tax=Mameliella sp. CS4 TaxID=2862329 RepID=UPI001C5CDBDF|nr:hypothetical protein [Mameliella sp. CS4]MBW4985673.1 hypothetical protein [Mameliella sp. CS4]
MSIAETPATTDMPRKAISPEQVAYLIAALLVGTGAAMTALFGLAGLAMTALALVPVVYVVLILISVGK